MRFLLALIATIAMPWAAGAGDKHHDHKHGHVHHHPGHAHHGHAHPVHGHHHGYVHHHGYYADCSWYNRHYYWPRPAEPPECPPRFHLYGMAVGNYHTRWPYYSYRAAWASPEPSIQARTILPPW